jgi:putative membrane protein
VVRPLSFRRNGFAWIPGVVLLRKGAVWRSLTIVPEARAQSIGMTQGPIYRALGLARIHVHTVTGPVRAELGGLATADVLSFFDAESAKVVSAVGADATHRWRADGASA